MDYGEPPQDQTPGWKPDPTNPKKQRKWDGQRWLNMTKTKRLDRIPNIPNWGWIAIAVLAFVVGIGIGGAGNSDESETDSLKEANRDQARQLTAMETKLELANLKAKRIANQTSPADVKRAEQELAAVRGETGEVEEEAALATIPGDGIWQAEVDFTPGTYRSEGGSGCYWATLNSADTTDIASNNLGDGPQVADIETPYFDTQGCGEWTLEE